MLAPKARRRLTLPESIGMQLTEKTAWGRGYPLEARLSSYNALINAARRYCVPVALCKEPKEVWNRLRLKGRCNCMA